MTKNTKQIAKIVDNEILEQNEQILADIVNQEKEAAQNNIDEANRYMLTVEEWNEIYEELQVEL